MKLKKAYKKFISSIDLSDEEYESMRKNIIDKKSSNGIRFKLRYACLIALLLLVGIVSYKTDIVSAVEAKISQCFSITENKDKGYFNAKSKVFLDKKYNEDVFKKDEYYSLETLEDKLEMPLLKNKYIKADLFRTSMVEVKDNYIASAGFITVDDDKSLFTNESIQLSIFFQTPDTDQSSSFSIGGDVTHSTYYIKNLDTEALLVKAGYTVLVEFVYDDIEYFVEMFSILNYTSEKNIDYSEVYKILDAFTL